MDPTSAESDRVDGLLDALDEVDGALRTLYRQLAGDPDLASEYEPRLKELHAKRLDLAQRVGLAILAQRRASDRVDEALSESMAAFAETVQNGGDPISSVVNTEPAAEAEEESPPSSAPASDAQLAQWKTVVRTSGLGSGLRAAPSETTAWALVLHELMDTVGPPRNLHASIGVIEEVDALDHIATDDEQDLWARLPKNAQQLWLTMLVARTRALKELPSASDGTKTTVKEIIGRYPAWAKAHNPGHVNGMQVRHAPIHGSWGQDARESWRALEDLLGEELAVRSPNAAEKKQAKRTGHDDADEPDLDPAWRVLPLVRGRKAILLGGDPREPNRERLEQALQLSSLEWPSIDGPRKVESVVERIGKQAYGLVLVLQTFVAHKQSEPIIEAAKAAGIPWALVAGYGVQAVKLGLERFLGGPRSGVSVPHEDNPEGHDAERHAPGGGGPR